MPTQQVETNRRGSNAENSTLDTSTSPENHPYKREREQIVENAKKHGGYSQEVAELLVEKLDSLLKDPAHSQSAKEVYEGVRAGNLAPFQEFFKEFDKRYQDELSRQTAKLGEQLEEASQKLKEADARTNGGQADPKEGSGESTPGQETKKDEPSTNTKESTEPKTVDPEESKPSLEPEVKIEPLVARSSRVTFHVRTNGCGLKTVARDLQINSKGEVEMRFEKRSGESVWLAANDHTTGIKVSALYCHQGKVYDAKGGEVTQLQWGCNRVNVSHALNYTDPIKEGGIAGIRDGYLKDLSHNGRQVVFTKGLPPALKKADVEQSDASKPRSQTPDVRLPKPPQNPAKEDIPQKRITFDTSLAGNRVQNTPRDLRLNTDGSLQMRFIDRNNESVWLEPNDRSTGINCTCLYRHNGSLYDASGNKVDTLSWGGRQQDADFVLGYVDPLKKGEVSGIKNGYLNDVSLNGKRVVFTEGLPQGVIPKESVEVESSNTSGETHSQQYSGHQGYQQSYNNQRYNSYQPQSPRPLQRFRARFGRWRRR